MRVYMNHNTTSILEMDLYLFSYLCLSVLYVIMTNLKCAAYTQEEIDKAKKEMIKKETFWQPVKGQLGCWPSGVVPYIIRTGFNNEQIQHIMRHIYQIQNRTCVRWVEKQRGKTYSKYVEFYHSERSDLCATAEHGNEYMPSGIKTRLSLGDECFPSENIIHEMLHALGFIHEHSRIDRDCYVSINDEYKKTDKNFKVVYDDLLFEKWPYDKRSVMQYVRLPEEHWNTSYIIKDKDEPFGGIIFKYRLGDAHGFWGWTRTRRGILTKLDAYKINYKFCGAPDFCDTQPKICQDIEEEERWTGCKQLYMDIASGKIKPTN